MILFSRKPISVMIGSVAGLGFLPLAPGTWASLAAALAGFIGGKSAVLGMILLSVPLSFLAAPGAIRFSGGKDPGFFVMDEVAGMAVALWGVPWSETEGASRFIWCAAALALFRFFDIAKPLGIRRIDRGKSSAAVTLDDLAAGLYALVILKAVQWWVW